MWSGMRVLQRSLVVALLVVMPLAVLARGGDQWFSAWSVSHGLRLTTPAVSGTTVRMVLRPTISGSELRVKLENTMGTAPVSFSAAHIGVRAAAAEVVAGTNKPLTFNGQSNLTLAPGAGAYSDPIKFHVQAFQELTASLDVASA